MKPQEPPGKGPKCLWRCAHPKARRKKPHNPPNRRVRTRTHGGVTGKACEGLPMSISEGKEREEAVMARIRARRQDSGKRAAIYARVSDKSQAEEDKTSLPEQTSEMEAYCERRGLTITARYQEVGRGWSKKRPEFQRMLADARRGRFDTIVCWKSDRLSRGDVPPPPLSWRSSRPIRSTSKPSWTPST